MIRRRHKFLIVLLLLALVTVVLCHEIAPAKAIPPPTLMQQGKAFYDQGRFIDAIALLKQAAATYQAQGDSLRQAIALSNLALAYQRSGQWREANQAIAQSLTLLKQRSIQTLPYLAQALTIQGDLQLEIGQTETAIAAWQQAERIYQQLNDTNGIAQAQMKQAQGLRVLGYYRRALTLLIDLHKRLQNQPDSMTKVVQLRSLGNALRLVGNLDQSRLVLQQGLEMVKRLSPSPEHSAILFSLGNTARAQRNTLAAITFYQDAIKLASTNIDKVQVQINWFSLLVETEQHSTAQTLLPDIQSQLATLPPSQASIYARIHLAQSWMKLIMDQRSTFLMPVAHLLTTTIQDARSFGNRQAEVYAIGTLGNVYEYTGQWNEGQRLTQQALNLAQGLNAPDVSYRWHWQLGRLLKQRNKISDAIAAYDAAVNELQSLRGDLVAMNQEVQFSFRESVEPVYRESVELLVQSNQSIEQNLDKARQRIESLQLAELDNFFREACLDARTVLLDQIVDRDNPTTAIVYPILLPDQLEVIVKIPHQPLHHHTIQLSKQKVESVLQQLQQNLTELDATDTIQSLSQQVYRWLIQPIEPDLERQNVNTLVFVLDGALRSIPMAALYNGKHYLVEKYAVALSVGLQILPPKSLFIDRLNVLAAGLIEPPPEFRQQFPSLPEIKSEFDLIAKAGVTIQPLLNQAFTSQTLEKQISSTEFNVVHLATHGQFSSQAKDTFILAADGPINVAQLDTLLRSRQQQSRTSAIELLVLSACQTAEGDDRATLGLAGVAVKAGAQSTLASLWHIDDRSTALLMGEFYRELVNSKVTKAEALRRAQLALIKQYPNYKHTGFWAAYVLVGNWL